MPAATSPDRITIYGFQPDDAFPERFVRMLAEVTPSRDARLLSERLEALLDAARSWQLTAYLTAQGADLYGVERPYDCDPLVDFLMTGPDLGDPRYVNYRYVAEADRPTLHSLIERLLTEPIFPKEKEEWIAALSRLQTSRGPVVTVYRR